MPGAVTRYPTEKRASILANIYARLLYFVVASSRLSGRRRAATRPRVHSIQDPASVLRGTPLPRTPVNRRIGLAPGAGAGVLSGLPTATPLPSRPLSPPRPGAPLQGATTPPSPP